MKLTENQEMVLVAMYGPYPMETEAFKRLRRSGPALVKKGLLVCTRKGFWNGGWWEPAEYDFTLKGLEIARDLFAVQEMVKIIERASTLQTRLRGRFLVLKRGLFS
jgi:hypothetical protein